MKERLHKLFNQDYPGVEHFLSEVVVPVFGNDINTVDRNLYDEYNIRCDNAGIVSLRYIADISTVNANNIVLLDVTLSDRINIERSRVNIQMLIRAIVQAYSHILIVFHYEDVKDKPWRFSYAYKEDTLANTTAPKRFTYVFGKDYNGWTAAERFEELALTERNDEDIVEAFSVEALSKEFFDKYRELYADFVQFITGCRYEKVAGKWEEHQLQEPNPQFVTTFDSDKKLARDYVKKMFGRIVFLYFLQRKGWLAGNYSYMQDLWTNSQLKDDYLDKVLEPLFFYVLNEEKSKRGPEAQTLPGWEEIPYLNGGLFAQEEIDIRTCVFPRGLFQRLFEFLNRYNFTIDENDAEDSEIGIDPEMLGRIFESLLEDNKEKGAFYTPKFIVDYMCREAIIAYLCNGYVKEAHPLIREFVETLNGDLLNQEQRKKLRKKLIDVKICDPAIGSGAFPMGMVNLLSKLYIAMKAETDTSVMKRHIMENNIYGVDLEKGAVDIARLRFWLAMIVDETEPRPLPNLHFKIMQGNSLLESYRGRDLSKLVYGKTPGTLDYYAEKRKLLQDDIKSYYQNSDHSKSGPQLNRIKDQIRVRFSDEYDITLPSDEEGGDPSANQHFFLWHTWFSDIFDAGGFDIVIGNPPYVVTKKDEYPMYNWNLDLYKIFFETAIKNLINSKGVICYITPKFYLLNFDDVDMRKYFMDKIRVRKLAFCNPFEVVTENVVTILEPGKNGEIIEVYKYDNVKLIFQRLEDLNIAYCHSNKYHEMIVGISKSIGDLLMKILGDHPTLEKISSSKRGAEASKNYLRTQATGIPALIGRDMKKYSILWESTYLPYSHKEYGRLSSFFDKDLLFLRRVDSCLEATISLDKIYGYNKNVYGIRIEDSKFEPKYILALLNSKLLDFFYKKRFSTKKEDAFPEIQTYLYEQLPIPAVSKEIQKRFVEIVDFILFNKSQNPSTNTIDKEKQIDLMTYRLYDLSYDEVKIVDPDFSLSREEYENSMN